MGFDAGRLHRGELIAAGGGVVLLLAMFLLPWFRDGSAGGASASRGVAASLDGWNSLTYVRWVLLIAVAISIAVVALTATRQSPAIPVTFSMLACVLGGLSSLLLIYRVIDHPTVTASVATVAARPGIYFGLVGALLIAYGGYLSMRAESSQFGDTAAIETVVVAPPEPGSAQLTGSGSESRSESGSARSTGRDVERA